MTTRGGRQSVTLLLVVGATVFGMVLAGGLDLAPVSRAQSGGGGAVSVDAAPSGLPGFADLAAAVSPAVVSIRATKFEDATGRRGGDPFEFFFGPRRRGPQDPRQEQEPEQRRADSSGSGFVISADGYIVTNHHVIEDAEELTVVLNDREYPAEVRGDDPATDIALLKIEPTEDLAYLQLADSDVVRVGDWLMVIGSPLQLQNSVSVGVVSAKGRSINITPDNSLENFIQTDAAINFGNSGGPLVNLQGQVIGIATAINFGAENIGFAVPVNILKGILPQLRDNGVVRRGYLGVNIEDLDFDSAEAFGLDGTDGALITDVRADGPAREAGLRHGDVILRVDDHQITSNRDLIDYVSSIQPGETVEVEVFRGGDRVTLDVTLGERPSNEAPPIEVEEERDGGIDWLGIRYQSLTSNLRGTHSIPDDVDGVMVTQIQPDSPLYDEGVRPGDILTEVNRDSVSGVEDFESAVGNVPEGSLVRFYVTRVDPRSGQTASFFAIVRVP